MFFNQGRMSLMVFFLYTNVLQHQVNVHQLYDLFRRNQKQAAAWIELS